MHILPCMFGHETLLFVINIIRKIKILLSNIIQNALVDFNIILSVMHYVGLIHSMHILGLSGWLFKTQ